MSDLYPIKEPLPEVSTGRACAICGRTVHTKRAVFMQKAEVMICKSCATDLASSLSSMVETSIPQPTKPAAKPVRVVRKADTPFDTENFKQTMKTEFLRLMLEYAAQHKD